MAPIVQLKVLATLAVKEIFGPTPLHVVAVAELLTTGVGFTVTVIVNAAPTQLPPLDAGVIIY